MGFWAPPMTRSENKSLLIKGGHLIDPAAKINAAMDIILREGRVAEVALPNKTRGSADEKMRGAGNRAPRRELALVAQIARYARERR